MNTLQILIVITVAVLIAGCAGANEKNPQNAVSKEYCPVNGKLLTPKNTIIVTNDGKLYKVCCNYCKRKLEHNFKKYEKYGVNTGTVR